VGIQKNGMTGQLIIKGSGNLTATGGVNAAGIGGGNGGSGTGITLQSIGIVTATGGANGEHIGNENNLPSGITGTSNRNGGLIIESNTAELNSIQVLMNFWQYGVVL